MPQPPAPQRPADPPLSASGVAAFQAGQSVAGLSAPGTAGPGETSAGGTSLGGRSRFAAEELAVVLSHYDLGVLESVQEFPRGSRKAPKLLVRSEKGAYLLKRRARGKDDPPKVAFAHAVQQHLARQQFPLPHRIPTRRARSTLLQWNDAVYELFEFIKGASYDTSLEETYDAGKTLAVFHQLLDDFTCPHEPAQGSYHRARSVDASVHQIPRTLKQINPDAFERRREDIGRLIQYLHKAYHEAARHADHAGLPEWPDQVVHCDWHPGNTLFRGKRVVAVIDYDAARRQPRIIDVANAALQFSILGGGDDTTQWPDHPDLSRLKRFIRGYDSVPNALLSRAELHAMPHLMIEALIAESVIPVAATGTFARLEGARFLVMVHRKVRWLRKHAADLIKAVDE